MIRIAQERVQDLFGLAEAESRHRRDALADRYVRLARRIGTRYNVRLPPAFRELYCRGCSCFWAEGRTVRTRLRGGRRVRTCLKCGRARRVPIGERAPVVALPAADARKEARESEPALAFGEDEEPAPEDEGEEDA